MCHEVIAVELSYRAICSDTGKTVVTDHVLDHCYGSANGTELNDVSPLLLNHNWGLWQVRLMHVECERNCVHYSDFER
jgi:hypothetical protein